MSTTLGDKLNDIIQDAANSIVIDADDREYELETRIDELQAENDGLKEQVNDLLDTIERAKL